MSPEHNIGRPHASTQHSPELAVWHAASSNTQEFITDTRTEFPHRLPGLFGRLSAFLVVTLLLLLLLGSIGWAPRPLFDGKEGRQRHRSPALYTASGQDRKDGSNQ